MTLATNSPPAAAAGSGAPRFRNVPAYVDSEGAEAAELAARAGLDLDLWQRENLTDTLGVRADGRWASLETGMSVPRQNGKGGIIEARKLYGLFLSEHEQLIMYSAHQFKTATEMFARVKDLITNCDELRRKVHRVHEATGQEGISLLNGRRLLYVARSRSSGRGFTGDCNIWDEAQALTNAQVAAQMPTLSARKNPQMCLFGTPPDTRKGEGEYFAPFRKRGLASARRLMWVEYSPEDGYDPADRALWRRVNPAIPHRISEEFVESEFSAMGNGGPEFCRERLGAWDRDPTEGWLVISRVDWTAAKDPESVALDPVAFALDASPDRAWASISSAGRRADGLLHGELVDRRPGTGWVVDRALGLVERWNPCAFVVDPASPAGSLITDLETAGVSVYQTSARQMAQAYGALYDAVAGEDRSARVLRWRPGTYELGDALTAAVRAASTRAVSGGSAWDRNGCSVDLAPLVSLTLAAYGFSVNAPGVSDPLENIW